MASPSSPFQNAVLKSLSASDLKLIQSPLESTALPVRHVIEEPNLFRILQLKHALFQIESVGAFRHLLRPTRWGTRLLGSVMTCSLRQNLSAS
jgi:hypothetical protein